VRTDSIQKFAVVNSSNIVKKQTSWNRLAKAGIVSHFYQTTCVII